VAVSNASHWLMAVVASPQPAPALGVAELSEHRAQVLELAHVTAELTERAGLVEQTARVRRLEQSMSEATVLQPMCNATSAVDGYNAGVASSPGCAAGRGASAVALLRHTPRDTSANAAHSLTGDAAGMQVQLSPDTSGSPVTIRLVDMVAQLEEARSGLDELRAENQSLFHDAEQQRQRLRTETEQVRSIVLDNQRRLDALTSETRHTRNIASTSIEVVQPIIKRLEDHSLQAGVDMKAAMLAVENFGAELRTLQQRIDGFQEAAQQQLQQALSTMEERVSRQAAETSRGLVSVEKMSEQCRTLHDQAKGDRADLLRIEAELQDIRMRPAKAGVVPAMLQLEDLPGAWRSALDDCTQRAQRATENLGNRLEEQHRHLEQRLRAEITSMVETRVITESSARVAGAEAAAGDAAILAQAAVDSAKKAERLAEEHRAEWRTELRAAACAWLDKSAARPPGPMTVLPEQEHELDSGARILLGSRASPECERDASHRASLDVRRKAPSSQESPRREDLSGGLRIKNS